MKATVVIHRRVTGVRSAALAACALSAALLALGGGVAQARLVPAGSFGSGQIGEDPMGVAVDESSQSVYVSNFLSAKIDEFNSAEKLVSPPSPFATNGGHQSGVAVNPTDGDVYAVDNIINETSEVYETVVATYDPRSGAQLSSFPVSGCAGGFSGNFTLVQIATDSSGDVYLPCAPNSAVQEYSPSGTLLQTFTGSGSEALKEPTGVAVEPSGNVWVADTGNGRVEEFSANGSFERSISTLECRPSRSTLPVACLRLCSTAPTCAARSRHPVTTSWSTAPPERRLPPTLALAKSRIKPMRLMEPSTWWP